MQTATIPMNIRIKNVHSFCTMVDVMTTGSIEEKRVRKKACFLLWENHGAPRNTQGREWRFRTKHAWDGVPGVKECGGRLGRGCGKLREHVTQTPDGLRGREGFHSSQKRQGLCRTLTSHHFSRSLEKNQVSIYICSL